MKQDDKAQANLALLGTLKISNGDRKKVRAYLEELILLRNKQGRFNEAAEIFNLLFNFELVEKEQHLDLFEKSANHPYEQFLAFVDLAIRLRH